VTAVRADALSLVSELGGAINGNPDRALATTINVAFPDLNSEAAMVALKGIAAVSNGSACTSQSYEPSHVLRAMGLSEERASGALRLSWSHLGERPDWPAIGEALRPFISPPQR
jgi:cysteine desulfurase